MIFFNLKDYSNFSFLTCVSKLSKTNFKSNFCYFLIVAATIFLQLIPSASIKAQNVLDNAGLTATTPASAAYSFRKLSSVYNGAAVRVRRSTDNAEVNVYFDASNEVSATSNVDFIADITLLNTTSFTVKSGTITTTSGSVAVTGTGTNFLTEFSPGDVLVSFGTVPLKVIGTVASITDDFNLTLIAPATATTAFSNIAYRGTPAQNFATFYTGATTNCTVKTWYDQSGANKHATAPSDAAQPFIVQLGLLKKLNGRPILTWTTTAQVLECNVNTTTQTVNAVRNLRSVGNDNDYQTLFASPKNTDFSIRRGYSTTVSGGDWVTNTGITPANWVNGEQTMIGRIPLHTLTASANAPRTNTTFSISSTFGGRGMTGNIGVSEMILFPTTLPAATRETLECNQLNYFDIITALLTFSNQSPVTCSGTAFNTALANPNVKYSWPVPVINPVGSLAGSSAQASVSSYSQTLTNLTANPATATYIVTPTLCGVSGTPFTVTVTVNPLPTTLPTITPNYCTGNGFVTLTSSAGTAYLWSTGQTTQAINVSNAGVYTVATSVNPYGCATVQSINVAQELVVNGNFNAGNTGFISAYVNNQTIVTTEGTYAVRTNAALVHPVFHGKDHTTGTGNFMIVNGKNNSLGDKVWSQNGIAVQTNTTYYFSAWALTLNGTNNAVLQFSINGLQTGSIAYLPAGYTNVNGPYTWVRIFGQWNSGFLTTADVSIVNLNSAAADNDFGLDDISFGTLSPVTLSAVPTQNSGNAACFADTLYLNANVIGGASPYSYSWTGPNSFASSVNNPVVSTNATAAQNGLYNLTVTDGFGCVVNTSLTVNIAPLPTDKITSATVSPLCSGGTSSISLAASDVGVTYQLRDALNTDIGAPIPGDGNNLIFPAGIISTTSVFNVKATNDNSGCIVQMTNPVTVTVSTTPVLAITNQAVCAGTVDLTLPAVTAGSTGSGTLTYWTDAAATVAMANPNSVSASGTYYIKSDVVGCSDIEPVVVSINPAPSPAFGYPVTAICTTNANPFPTVTGVAGTFSATPVGLSFVNTSTGQINLAASTPGTYTVRNTVGCTNDFATQSVTIKALPKAGFSFGSTNDLCQSINLANQIPTLVDPSTAGVGTFATTTGLVISNTTTGAINVGASTPGNYAMWRTIPASGGCPAVADTVFLDVNPYTNTGIVFTSASDSTICLGQAVNLYSTPVPYISVLFREKFNSTVLSWTKTNNSTGGTVANSAWATRANNYVENAQTFSSNDNSSFISTSSLNQGAGSTTETILRSPALNTVNFSTLQLDFFQYFNRSANGVATVEYSVNNSVWNVLATYNTNQGTSNAFVNTTINLNAFTGQPVFYIRFRYNAQFDGNWSIDNVSVSGNSTNYTYGWSSFPAGFTSSVPNPVAVIPPANTFYVLTAINSYGCSQPAVPVPVTVLPSPTLGGIAQPTVACIGNGATITLTGLVPNSNSTVSYEINGVAQTPVTNVIANGAGTASFLSSGLTAANNGQQLKITSITNGNCTTSFNIFILINVQTTITWTGTFTSDWFDAQNWCGGIPTSTTDVTIPNGMPNYPEIPTGTGTVRNIIIQNAASVLVNGGKLSISGTITNSGIFDATNGTIDLNGTALQNISGNSFLTNSVKHLRISNTAVTISNTAGNVFNIIDSLSFGTSNATLNTGNNLVLLSTATGTARIADITNDGANTNNKFSGTVTVERYFPGKRAWRLVTAPLSSTGSVYNTWQNGGVYTPNRGTWVTGNPVANGLDASPLNNFSLKQGTALTPIGNTIDTLLSTAASSAANKAFFLFVRGDRTAANQYTNFFNNTTLSAKGILQTGLQTFDASSAVAGGLTMIGNPYASPVDFFKTTRNNVADFLYVWDPQLGGANNVGGYVALTGDNAGNYTAVPASTGGLSNILQSGQAFIVKTIAAGAASLEFNENDKSDVNNTNAFRPARQVKSLRVNLNQLERNDSTILTDGILVQFDKDFSDEIDAKDAIKLGNVNEMFSIQKTKGTLTVERRSELTANDTIYLKLTRAKQRNYRFQFLPTDLDATTEAFIEDSYTNAKTALNTFGISNYDFTVNGDAKSAAADRFKIVFKQTALAPLPVTFKTIKAYQQEAAIAVDWKVENEMNIAKYEVEKSSDGINFKKVTTTAAAGSAGVSTVYNWLDQEPFTGNNFYRVRSIDTDGKFAYTSTVLVKISQFVPSIRVYPNPVTDNVIGTEFKNMSSGLYSVKLLNSTGQTLLIKTINHTAGSSIHAVQPDQKLVSGFYQMEVTAPDKTMRSVKVIVK